MATLISKEHEAVSKVGLKDGVKHQLNCDYCSAPLAIVWEVFPDFRHDDGTTHWCNYQAKCPYCRNQSPIKKVYGEIRILGIVKELQREDGSSYEQKLVNVDDIKYIPKDDLCLIMTSTEVRGKKSNQVILDEYVK